MRMLSTKYRLLGLIGIVLIIGFLTTSVAGYIAARDAIMEGVAEHALPLTSDNIYSEIQKDLLRPVFISSLMAQDTFLRDWMLNGEKDTGQIVRYLKEVKNKFGTISSFLVSERTHKYYYADGILKTVRDGEPRDKWFFRVRKMKTPYESNVDYDMANRDTMTIFINYRVLDYQGNFIGATGVGLALDTVSRIIDNYQERFHRSIFFVDPQGGIVMAGKSMMQLHGSIRSLPGLRDIAGDILKGTDKPTRLAYVIGNATTLVNSRFIPELGWYLVVEQDISSDVLPPRQLFEANLAISAAVTLLVLAITLLAINRYQRRLERAAATDSLTGLLNRQAFDLIFKQSTLEVDRAKLPLSIILFDIDSFKQVNDTYGHLAGDEVLRAIAQLARDVVRESDVISRWGGEEFLILLKNCPLDRAAGVAEKLRDAIARHRVAPAPSELPITISLGVAQFAPPESQAKLFSRADTALYRAKLGGRNRVEVCVDQCDAAG